jgi:hypothetical protein
MNFFKRKPKPSRPPEKLTPLRIDFVGEQAGPVEEELKSQFGRVLERSTPVRSAYLARVSYGEPLGYSVALCIRSTSGSDDCLRHCLASIFAETFRSEEYLDIIFIRDDQEERLKRVCNAFYEVI